MDTIKSCYLLFIFFLPVFTFDNINTLKSISVTFRHGDRTPEPPPIGFYPNDPYLNYPMEPMGQGGLTNDGKKREYQIGLKLRERYNAFLGDTYRSKDVFVTATSYERVEMSLLLVLAGLYPPKDKQVWKNGFNWQPIPIESVPMNIRGIVDTNNCPTLLKEKETVKASKEYQKEISAFKDVMKKLSNFTGMEITNTNPIFHLYHTLTAESTMGLKLPDWTKPYFPNGPIRDAALLEYRTLNYNTKMKKLNGGIQIRKILNDILFDKKRSTKKVNLYSAHESTVASLLYALNEWHNSVPEYGSAVIIELHENNGKIFLKTVYYNSIPPTFETRIIPGCSEYCPIEDFLKILKNVIADDVIESCFGPENNSLLIPKSENPTAWIYKNIREWYGV